MNIKIKQNNLRIFAAILLLSLTLFSFSFISPVGVSAQSAEELCGNKVRPEACADAVKKDCKSKTGSSKSKCEKDRAADFKDKEITMFSPQHASSGGGQCGKVNPVKTRINFGCLGDKGPANMGPVEDFLYAIVRFLSAGVGLAIVAYIILAGIKYSASEGNPEATQKAKTKIKDAVIGLFIYLLMFALVQYLVPGGIFAGSLIAPDQIISIIKVI